MIHSLFSDVVGHKTLLEILSKTVAHPASGYLFSGPDGVGKRMIAERFMKILCDVRATQSLLSHPDFIPLVCEEGKRAFSVEQVRELMQRMQLSSAYGGRKIAYISDAERLNEASSNAFLKAVEEPSAGAVYVFVTEEPERLPATLRSRLTPVTFGRVTTEELRGWMQREGFTQEESERYLERASGCPGMIKRFLADDQSWIERENLVRETWKIVLEGSVGKSCGMLEQLSQRIEKMDDADVEWRTVLRIMMRECSRTFSERPQESARMAHGLFHAWRLVGSSLSPRLALEWSAIQPYLREEPFIPSFLHPSYL